MTPPESWQPEWLQAATCTIHEPQVWRGVETQYASSTLLLVDDLDEHDLLEQMLEGSKPPLPPTAPVDGRPKHFLLTTPFRYAPMQPSRFRLAGQHGIWYGARALETACAEVAYWRMRFILDSAGLRDAKIITSHTFFAAAIDGHGIDLMAPPWVAHRPSWTGDDYAETHRLAQAASEASVEVIQYESVRHPGHACFAVLAADVLSEPSGGLDRTRQKWSCTATRDHVMMVSDMDRTQRFEFSC